MKFLKNENKNIFDLVKSNDCYKTTINGYFSKFYDYFRNKKKFIICKTLYLKQEIFDFIFNEFYNSYFAKEYLYAYNYQISKDIFILRIKELNDEDKIKEESLNYSHALELNIDKQMINDNKEILIALFEKNRNIFFDILKKILGFMYPKKHFDFYRFILFLMKHYPKKMDEILPNLFSIKIIEDYRDENNKDIKMVNFYRNQIIKNIFNKSKVEIFSNLDFINSSDIFKNLDSSIYLLNNINNNEATLYIMNKIKHTFLNNNNNLFFIHFIEKSISNRYAFDTIFNELKEKDKEYLFNNYKKSIIKSLYDYSQINGYYYIQKIIQFLRNFLSEEEIKMIIYVPFIEKEKESMYINYLEDEFIKDENISKEPIKCNYKKNKKNFYEKKKKFLLNYCITKRKVLNYETIAILLEFCEKKNYILSIFSFTLYNFDYIHNFKILEYMEYFAKDKNKEKIKELGQKFNEFSLFLESILSQTKNLCNFNDLEKTLFINYVTIINFELTPYKLKQFFGIDNREDLENANINNQKAKLNNISEKELLIILSIYEIKGTPIIPIKKYLPCFYEQIESFYPKYKEMNIHPLCLKDSFDVKFYEIIKKELSNITEEYIKNLLGLPLNNYLFILENENSIINNLEINQNIEKLIMNLLNNNNIIPFYDSNQNDDFFNYLISAEKEAIFYKMCVFSLLDFNKTSAIIIEKCFENYKNNKNRDILIEYRNYLKQVKLICQYIILNNIKKENKNSIVDIYNIIYEDKNITEEMINKLKSMKNNIDLKQIQYYILKGCKETNLINDDFYKGVISWISDYLKKDDIKKELDYIENQKLNILSYFSYLNYSIKIIIIWIDKLKEIKEIQNFDYKKFIHWNKKEIVIIDYVFCQSKDIAKNQLTNSLYEFFKESINRFTYVKKGRRMEIKDSIKKVKNHISIPYYFVKEKGEFVETNSDINLMEFITLKITSMWNFIYTFICGIKYKVNKYYSLGYYALYNETKNRHLSSAISYNLLKFIYEKLLKKDIKSLYESIAPCNIAYAWDDKIGELFNPLLENNDIIKSYIEETINDYKQPEYYDCLNQIMHKINEILNNIYPQFYFKNILSVDLTEIRKAIKNTKFISSDYLNSIFQVKALDNIFNIKSYLYSFLYRLFGILFLKKNNHLCYSVKYIEKYYKINITKGKKYKFKDFKNNLKNLKKSNKHPKIKLMKSINSNDSQSSKLKFNKSGKKIKYKLKIEAIDKPIINNKLFYSIIGINKFKREKIPSSSFQGHTPFKQFSVGQSNEIIYSKSFNNKIIIKPKPDLEFPKYSKNKHLSEKRHFTFKDYFLSMNIFDLIFSVKSVRDDIIYLEQNDISNILKHFSEKEDFIALLNYKLENKTIDDDVERLEKIIDEAN